LTELCYWNFVFVVDRSASTLSSTDIIHIKIIIIIIIIITSLNNHYFTSNYSILIRKQRYDK